MAQSWISFWLSTLILGDVFHFYDFIVLTIFPQLSVLCIHLDLTYEIQNDLINWPFHNPLLVIFQISQFVQM